MQYYNLRCIVSEVIVLTIVFRPGPVAGPGSRFWPGYRIIRVNFFILKKSKRCRFSKKKSTGYNRVFDRVARSHQVFPSSVFSLTWPDSSPGLGFKTMVLTMRYIYIYILFQLINNVQNLTKKSKFT
jgi:hypothetical protein